MEHTIKLKNEKAFLKKSYPVPLALRDKVRSEIRNMLNMGIIEHSNSQYCNPLRIVMKKDGSVRCCLDARFLNNVIEGDNESPPRIDEVMQKYLNKQCLTTLDLTHGYWQVPLDKQSRQYTAFIFEGHLYHFKRIPFGLKTAGSGFMRAIRLALGEDCDHFLTSYVDDLLIANENFNDHLKSLEIVFDKLMKNRFTLRITKAKFCQPEVAFLGFMLSPQGIRPDGEKLSKILNFQEPKNRVELQKFLGLCNYYRQFSLNHSKYIEPFRKLLSKNNAWEWSEYYSKAYEDLKENFVKVIQLSHYDNDKTFQLQTDGSDVGICGVLYQVDEEQNKRVISIESRCLIPAEKNYTTTEKELLAIVFSICKFRVYLIGRKFDIITDHQALTFLDRTQFLSARLCRWSLLIQEYDFNVKYCNGKENVVADFFSRNPNHEYVEETSQQIMISTLSCYHEGQSNNEAMDVLVMICRLELDSDLCTDLEKIADMQNNDEIIQQTVKNANINKNHEYCQHKNIWFHRKAQNDHWCLIIPEALQEPLIKAEHERLGHCGVYKTYNHLRKFYYWRNMNRAIKKYVRECDLCQRVKHLGQAAEGVYEHVYSEMPNDLVTVDFYGPLPRSIGGLQYIFVVVDAFSKYVQLYAIKRANTETVLRKLINNYFKEIGKPKRILSDNGTQFTSVNWRTTLEKEKVKVIYSSIRHPQSNPTERIMRELGKFFRIYCSEQHTRWGKHVKHIQELLNVTTHSSTGYTPYELHFGREPDEKIRELIEFPKNMPISHELKLTLAKENLSKSFKQRQKQQKSKSKIVYEIGDKVLLLVPHLSSNTDRVTHKFFHLYEGPYVITQSKGPNAFVLSHIDDRDKIKGTYNRLSLRKYFEATNED
uniref:RNA-directed DNA polymerase n=1 Tax=Bracon brevicornis TaxID=1563983 RepID=A0A6V7LHY6_9HYME